MSLAFECLSSISHQHSTDQLRSDHLVNRVTSVTITGGPTAQLSPHSDLRSYDPLVSRQSLWIVSPMLRFGLNICQLRQPFKHLHRICIKTRFKKFLIRMCIILTIISHSFHSLPFSQPFSQFFVIVFVEEYSCFAVNAQQKRLRY